MNEHESFSQVNVVFFFFLIIIVSLFWQMSRRSGRVVPGAENSLSRREGKI